MRETRSPRTAQPPPAAPSPSAGSPQDPRTAELAAERGYVEYCRRALAVQIEGVQNQVVSGRDVSGDNASAEALGRYLRTRARQVAEEPESPLFFGCLWFQDTEEAGQHRRQRYYIGRRPVSEDPTEPPLVIDWRAPVASMYYQAGPAHTYGIGVRRRFGWALGSRGLPEELTGFEDERLAGEYGPAATAEPGLSAMVAAEIERPRVGPMRDIVATIQPEQDVLVRGELTDSVCIQGAPGTGKTAVGLHRAAYLLYTYRRRLRRNGLLIIGPNPTFLQFIEQVLPALGESDVVQITVEELVERGPATGRDEEPTAVVKHSTEMARVLRRALYAGVREPTEALIVPEGSYRWRISVGELVDVQAEVLAADLPYGVGRERLRSRIAGLVQTQAERRAGPRSGAWLAKIAHARPVSACLDAAWPAGRPEELLFRLLSDPKMMAEAADGILDETQQAALIWTRPPRSARTARWSAADLFLLDELAGLIERPDGFGHVVVDEAQDLSPMQCRAIARRNAFGSLTVLGDLAQGTTPWSARNWAEQAEHLGKPQAQQVALTTGFRVPAVLTALANRLLETLGTDVPPARSLRGDGQLSIKHVDDLPQAVTAAVRAALDREGSVGVIAADGDAPALAQALTRAGIQVEGADPAQAEAGAVEAGAQPARVSVLPATLVKGLEFDHVVLVEPAAMVEAEERGTQRLYVAITRAVSRLDILHSRPLPAALAEDQG